MPGTSSLRYHTPEASTTAPARARDPSVKVTTYSSSCGVSPLTWAGTMRRAPNLWAWSTARSMSSPPEMPDGKPR
jgi:hypothetical protein